jgi:hypothetical protein
MTSNIITTYITNPTTNEAIKLLEARLADADHMLKQTIAQRETAAAELNRWTAGVHQRSAERSDIVEALDILRKAKGVKA